MCSCSYFSIKIQNRIIMACCLMHNLFIPPWQLTKYKMKSQKTTQSTIIFPEMEAMWIKLTHLQNGISGEMS
ncbi:hypothetical protein PHJA_002791200 [Phtheirospermum japonicum]|uniref:Uncharacterized protein n=1 Tax=Phtheirospermum japonicum TaxID=374723 RepID=A0A830DKM6_9LAMI|nr:hypothetical protein PHJA_002791200 [Phtheirospermum japonicum]